MSNEQHPIIPPPELVREWAQINGEKDLERFWMRLAIQAARWGADLELEACCAWLIANDNPRWALALQEGRRPKPPSLAEQALDAIDEEREDITLVSYKVIRRALERLQELEGAND